MQNTDKKTGAQAQPTSRTASVRGQAIDGLARRVTQRATDPDRSALSADESWTPLPTWRFDGGRHNNLTGLRRGLVTVIGPAATPTRASRQSRKGALWVVKCDCGVYSHRRTKSLKRAGWDACAHCCSKQAFSSTRPRRDP